jgi:putative transposase
VIHQFRSQYPIELMCRVLEVSRGGYYAWRRRQPSARAVVDLQLQVRIAASHRRSQGTYGSPRIQRDLRDEGIAVGRKRVARLLRTAGLQGVARRRFRVTTDSAHAFPVAPNVLNQQFALAAPNQAWAADLTYLATGEGWLYLAVVLDLHSRRVVGWATAPRCDRGVVLTALDRALALRGRPTLHHSDRGCQYASEEYRAALAARGVTVSMSRRGNCYDNAVVESFFSTLKRELVERQPWTSRIALTAALARYLEGWYNPFRRHSRLGYLSPVAFEHTRRQAA